MAGRKPKPTHIRLIEGSARPGRSAAEPKPEGNLLTPPERLNDAQREIWIEAIAAAPAGLLKSIDLSVFETWVVAYAFWRQSVQDVNTEGLVVKAPSGYPVPNPSLTNANKQAQIMLKAGAEMGFSPSSRTKVQVGEVPKAADPWADMAAAG